MLLKAIARVLVKAAGNLVGFGIAGDAIVGIWGAWDEYRKDSLQKRKEVEELATMDTAKVRIEATKIMDEVAAGLPESDCRAIWDYLTQVPAAIRRSQQRPQDPSGRSLSALLSLRRAEDLQIILPPKLPWFKVGDHPPGIGDWELQELLGMGGFGEVWKARNPYMPHSVALKFCLDPEAAKALRNEAVLLGRVASEGQHPRIVRLRNTYLSANPPCLEYEYVAGGDLAGLVYQQMQKHQGKMPVNLPRQIIRSLARAMKNPHQLKPPIVHRDLKPANILVQHLEGGKVDFRITDFGIGGVAASKAIEEARETSTSHFQTTAFRGAHTPLYASLQQIAGADPDPRDDVYAFGVIWYQLLVGDLSKPAPHGRGWRNPLLSQGVTAAELDLLESCFDDEREGRPADAGELAQRIEELDKKPPISPKLPPPQFAQDMTDALEEMRTKGDTRSYFVRQGPTRIADWQAAAQQGDLAAQWLLAHCLLEGTGAQQDFDAALSWLRQAAKSGLAVAQTDLGDCYYLGVGLEADTNEAFRLYTAAAAQGFREAEVDLGDCYWEGEGVAKDLAEAARHYRIAAEAGWARGQSSLGDCYFDGAGVEQDYHQAITWYRKAADQGYTGAHLKLGWCYESGKGFKKNPVEAVKWYYKAAEQGDAGGQFYIGNCYNHGYGVEQDIEQAKSWYRKAADQGHKKAKKELDKIEKATLPERLLAQVANAVGEDNRWSVVHQNNRVVNVVPVDWLTWLPPFGTYYDDPRLWLVVKCEWYGNRIDHFLEMHGVKGVRLAKKLAEFLFAEAPKFGFRPSAARKVTNYTHVSGRERLLEWDGDEPEPAVILAAVKTTLDDLYPKLEQLAGVLKPLCDSLSSAGPIEDDAAGENDDGDEAGPEDDEDATGYWAIAPYSADSPEEWQQVWDYDLANNVISIGWEGLGDISALDETSLRAVIDRTFSDYATQAKGMTFRMLWDFFHTIKEGDIIFARQGTKKLAAVGTVTRTAYYDPNKTSAAVGDWFTFAYHLDVRWEPFPRDKQFADIVFGIQTLHRVSEDKYLTLLGKPMSERRLIALRLLLEKGATSPETAVKFSTFREEAKAAGGIMYGYDNLSNAGQIEWLKKESQTGWFLHLTDTGRAALDAASAGETVEGEAPIATPPT